MKRFRVFGVWAVCLMVAPVAHAQGAQGVFAELFGASTTFGIHYDSRFSSRTRWGGRVGLAYTRSRSQDFFDSNPEATRGWSFPVAVNHLVGRGRHHAEIGVGVSYGLYTCKYHDPAGRQVEHDRSGTFGFLDLGYRYQPARGLMLRTRCRCLSLPEFGMEFLSQAAAANFSLPGGAPFPAARLRRNGIVKTA